MAAPVGIGQGLQIGAVIDDAGRILITDRQLDAIAQSGAKWIKINFRLGRFQNWTETTTFGYSALSLYDQIVSRAQLRNLQVLGELSNESWPGWLAMWQVNNAETTPGNGNNKYLSDFATYAAGVLAQHYQATGQITNWEVWNEPNLPLTYLYPSNFAWLLTDVHQAFKLAGADSASVVSGGIATLQDNTGALTSVSSGADYLTATYRQGQVLANWNAIKAADGSYPLDNVGQHLYIDPYTTTSAANVKLALDLIHNAYVAAEGGATNKMIVMTEFGWETNNVPEAVQADNLQITNTQFKATSFFLNGYWFFLQDEPGAVLYYGLLRSDATQKPAWNAFLATSDF
ncbi:MAG: hypothetical protein NVS4B8_03100 [Herpetosiphon sp.]